jgi:hypothetical protein
MLARTDPAGHLPQIVAISGQILPRHSFAKLTSQVILAIVQNLTT